MPEYKNPMCNKCGKEIKFIALRFHDGSIKNVPVQPEAQYILMQTAEKTEKGQFIYISQKIAIVHKEFCTTNYGPKKEAPAPEADNEKPPF